MVQCLLSNCQCTRGISRRSAHVLRKRTPDAFYLLLYCVLYWHYTTPTPLKNKKTGSFCILHFGSWNPDLYSQRPRFMLHLHLVKQKHHLCLTVNIFLSSAKFPKQKKLIRHRLNIQVARCGMPLRFASFPVVCYLCSALSLSSMALRARRMPMPNLNFALLYLPSLVLKLLCVLLDDDIA